MSSAATIRSGQLRHRIQLHVNEPERVDGGSSDARWVPWGKPAPCSITPLSGGKSFIAQQAQSRVTHIIALRYRAGISPHMRAKWGDRWFEFERVIDVESRRRKIEIMAVEVT